MKNKLLSTAMMLILFAGMLFAQKDIEIDYKAFSNLPDMTKSQVKRIKAADEIYFSETQHNYTRALSLYLEVYTEGLGYDPLDWRIAMCYLHSDDKPQAINYILKCNEGVSKLYHFYLGKAYHFSGQFDQAKENYKHFADSLLEADQKMFYSTFEVKKKNYIFEDVMQELLDACDVGINNSNDSVSINFENVRIINSENDELYPILHPDGILVYTSNKSVEIGEEASNYQIFGAACDSVLTIGFPKLTNKYPQDPEDNLLALPLSGYSEGLLYQSMKSAGGDVMLTYMKGKKIKGKAISKINSSSKEGAACFLGDSVLLFSSDRASKEGVNDLYIAFKGTSGKWSKPVLVGGNVNTSGNEEVLTYYGNELYYISNAKGGIGGYDIYKVPYLEENNWGEIQNLGYPINTADNDMGYFPVNDSAGFYCGVRPGGVGGLDIYIVTYDPLTVADTNVINTIIVDSVDFDLLGMDTILVNDSLLMDSVVIDSLFTDALLLLVENDSLLVKDSLFIAPLDSMIVDSVSMLMENDSKTVSDSVLLIPLDSSAVNALLEDEEVIEVKEVSDSTLVVE